MNEGKQGTLSEATPVRIGLIIVFLGAFGSAVWWASSVSTKLEAIISSQIVSTATISDVKTLEIANAKEIAELKLKQAITDEAIRAMKK